LQLVIGDPGLSISEQQSQFSLWAIFSAPLMFSADLRTMAKESRDILLNREIIAINQDALARQGWCAEHNPSTYTRIWVRELEPSVSSTFAVNASPPRVGSSDRWAVVLENYNTIFNSQKIVLEPLRHFRISFQEQEDGRGDGDWTSFSVRDVTHKNDMGAFENTFTATVDESSVATFLVTRQTPHYTSTANAAAASH
jgi:hypothetical protein